MAGKNPDNSYGLNDRQLLFCHEYAKSLNATDAYRRAGYACKTDSMARKGGALLVAKGNIRAYLREILNLNSVTVINEIVAIALANITDVCTWTQDEIKLIPSHSLSLRGKTAIKSIKVKKRTTVSPDGAEETTIETEVVMHDKLSALEKLCKKLSLYPTETMAAITTLATKGLLLPEQTEVILNGLRHFDENLASLPGRKQGEDKPQFDRAAIEEGFGIVDTVAVSDSVAEG
jgi:phage terminase small subunit